MVSELKCISNFSTFPGFTEIGKIYYTDESHSIEDTTAGKLVWIYKNRQCTESIGYMLLQNFETIKE